MRIITRIFAFLICTSIYSQNETMFSLGMNIVDDSFTSTYNPLNTSESWNIGKIPSYFSLSSEIIDRTFLEVQISSNEYQKGKLVNGNILLTNKKYFSVDFLTKFKLLHSDKYTALSSSLFDPFISLGTGYTTIEKIDYYTINYGIGFYFWFPKSKYCNCHFNGNNGGNLGVLFSSLAKSSFKQSLYGNQIQHNFGLVYRFKQ